VREVFGISRSAAPTDVQPPAARPDTAPQAAPTQFSTIVTERAEQAYVGTALTLQLTIGFTLTVATIWLIRCSSATSAGGGTRPP
jgi:hypothetical protein